MTATLLPIPDDPRFPAMVQSWPSYQRFAGNFPRSAWLYDFELLLREFYPSANSRSLSLTARHHAPFPPNMEDDKCPPS